MRKSNFSASTARYTPGAGSILNPNEGEGQSLIEIVWKQQSLLQGSTPLGSAILSPKIFKRTCSRQKLLHHYIRNCSWQRTCLLAPPATIHIPTHLSCWWRGTLRAICSNEYDRCKKWEQAHTYGSVIPGCCKMVAYVAATALSPTIVAICSTPRVIGCNSDWTVAVHFTADTICICHVCIWFLFWCLKEQASIACQ